MNFARIALVVSVSACMVGSYAQDPVGPKGKPHHSSPIKPRTTEARVSELSKKLSLNADQKNKITKILNLHFERLKILAKNPKVSDSERKAKIYADRALVNKQIRALLSKSQQKKFDAMLAAGSKKS